jgi:anti-anti-sigma factor
MPNISSRQVEDVVVLDISGMIVGVAAEVVREAVHNLLNRGVTKIVMNLKDTRRIDERGIGILVECLLKVDRRVDGRIILLNPPKQTWAGLEGPILQRCFTIFYDEAEAVNSLSAVSSAKGAFDDIKCPHCGNVVHC